MLKLESRSVEHNPARTAGTESQPGSSMRDTRTTAAPKFLKRIRTILIDNFFVNQCTLHCTKCVNEQMPFTRAYFLFFLVNWVQQEEQTNYILIILTIVLRRRFRVNDSKFWELFKIFTLLTIS